MLGVRKCAVCNVHMQYKDGFMRSPAVQDEGLLLLYMIEILLGTVQCRAANGPPLVR